MAESPGNISQNSDEEGLDRNEILDRLRYLDGKIERGLPIQQELECQAVKLRLLRRLSRLIRRQITYMEKHKGKGTL